MRNSTDVRTVEGRPNPSRMSVREQEDLYLADAPSDATTSGRSTLAETDTSPIPDRPLVSSSSPHRSSPTLLMLLALALLLGGGIWWWHSRNGLQASYVTARAGRGSISRGVTATGQVNPVLTVVVGSYVSGVIRDIYCDYNTTVHKGQICARIDPRPYQLTVEQDQAALDSAKAQLNKDQANLAYARVNYDRVSKLGALQAASLDSVDVAKSALGQGEAQVTLDFATIEERQAALEAAKVNLGYTNITSPVNGTVVSRNVTIGQTVAASFQTPTLFLIAQDLTKMQVDTNVSESDIESESHGLAPGDAAVFTVEAFPTWTFRGVVSQVRQAPQTVQNVVTYDVVIAVDNPELKLRPGMTATVRIITEHHANVLRVPNAALRFNPGGLAGISSASVARSRQMARVWILSNGKAVPVSIRPGLSDGAYTEVLSGDLRAGSQVIISEIGDKGSKKAASRTSAPAFARQ